MATPSATATDAPIKIFGNVVCPFAMRALIVLYEKDVPHEYQHIELGANKPLWYWDVNPRGTVPAARLANGNTLFESLFIAQYLDAEYETPTMEKQYLFPNLPELRAAMRGFFDACSTLIGSMYRYLMDDSVERRRAVEANTDIVEKLLAAQSQGPFFFGARFSMADVFIVPFLDRFRHTLLEYCGYRVFEAAPRLHALMTAAELRPAVRRAQKPAEYYVRFYHGYAKRDKKGRRWAVACRSGDPFARRIHLAAKLTDAVVDVTATEDGPETPKLTQASGLTISGCSNIMLYLLESAPGQPFVPANPETYARTHFLADEADALGTAVWEFTNATGDDALKVQVAKALAKIDAAIGAGPFSDGDAPAFGDIVVVPHLVTIRDAGSLRPLLDAAPKAAALLAAAERHAAFGDALTATA